MRLLASVLRLGHGVSSRRRASGRGPEDENERMSPLLRAAGCLLPLCAAAVWAGQGAVGAEPPLEHGVARTEPPLEQLEVVGTTPLGGGADAAGVPGPVQSASADEIRRRGAADLTDFLKRSFGSVFVNDAQSNPLQPDVQYRGFVGSPLLGLPQGIAVYQDGVRVNEPFGDTVDWALIPEAAIDRIDLVPGSNPLFGLNALGGALSIRTKDGFTSPGTRLEVSGGSWSRRSFEAETGGSVDGRFGYFLSGSTLDEDGWREFSPTHATRGFARLGWQTAATSVSASLTYADTDLTGNGAAPVQLLDVDRRATFTHPDRTRNALTQVEVSAEGAVSDSLSLTGNVYSRRSDIDTVNGDNSDFEPCDATPAWLCEQTGGGEQEVAADPAGLPIAAAPALLGATLNRTRTTQDGSGMALQASWSGRLAKRTNRLLVGVAYDRSSVGFDSSVELGSLDATRGAVGGGVLVGGGLTGLDADTSTGGVYLSDSWSVSPKVELTASGRENRTRVRLHDRLGSALNGAHTFARFNPALGMTLALRGALSYYASYSESSRTPSPVELTCADADAPCRLPNAFVADPSLEQVVASTLETGLRARRAGFDWHAGLFSTLNEHDILFVSAGALTNQGYFANVGRTRRRGVELGIQRRGSGAGLTWFADYTFLDATFEDALALASVNNPAAVDGQIFVKPGDRVPLVPRSLLKAGVRYGLTPKLDLGADVLVSSGQYLRGDEANLTPPLDGYGVIDLHAVYRPGRVVEVFANIDNLLDARYATFGVFGDATEVLGAAFGDRRYVSPGSPRGVWVGARFSF